MQAHRWPGNVRELENVIYRSAVIAPGDTILLKDLPADLRAEAGVPASADSKPPFAAAISEAGPGAAAGEQAATPPAPNAGPALTLETALDFLQAELARGDEPLLPRLQREMIARVLKAEGGDPAKAAKRLGLTKAALQKRLKEP